MIEWHIAHPTVRPCPDMAMDAIAPVRAFHRRIPGYAPTPLHSLPGLAARLGVEAIRVKDESFRFGLNAFKILGGLYAIGRHICRQRGLDIAQAGLEDLAAGTDEPITFVTATDGNHGRGVAYAAEQLGHRAVVYLPAGSSAVRLENIRSHGARAEMTDLNYDDAVRLADKKARENGWILIQDTAWPGYEDIPRWIMQGYGTLALEALEQLDAPPTHVFLQCGVGAFAGAMAGFFSENLGDAAPKCISVEPAAAHCIHASLAAGDGKPRRVGGSLSTLMAGLACGEPNIIGWDTLRHSLAASLSCRDQVAALGMRILAAPKPGDPPIVSGESGAAPAGALTLILTDGRYECLRRALGLDGTSRILLVSTEGDTDPELYERIVWFGEYPL